MHGLKTELFFNVGAAQGAAERALNAQRYITDILEEYVVPFAGYIGDQFTFRHDNARKYGTCATTM